ncbi:hypothetical protein M2451_002025 [Dysgonomonas sp. PFB1-18]|uniref:hypothetical protein n=1 Tax=unclassified Dysgonomonas TaxID=2630389 RepID=UPI00247720B7|nr:MULTISPECIES: hypothetical protein [unclassified Dysgonomonas]MDH6309791.1 hypothetical protein [Dysgonomonas sp. PF1-14]MDH6339201.1 hypothetical protein [Dysgonomonas sp. PF1-16]MDH6380700.1 hypothetical protein [Dysgonomonas sp. PFB1-18]MDH6398196.1 hypothetical protein [Dysgonomonas sp. PF1-23]
MSYRYNKSKNSFDGFLTFIPWVLVTLIFVTIFILLKKFVLNKSLTSSISDADAKQIVNRSSDRMQNGDTYMQGSVYLFNEMFSQAMFFPWLKNTDEGVVGKYILSVTSSEFRQLNSTYLLYKRDNLPSLSVSDRNADLLADLRDLFSSSEYKKYTSHLNLV